MGTAHTWPPPAPPPPCAQMGLPVWTAAASPARTIFSQCEPHESHGAEKTAVSFASVEETGACRVASAEAARRVCFGGSDFSPATTLRAETLAWGGPGNSSFLHTWARGPWGSSSPRSKPGRTGWDLRWLGKGEWLGSPLRTAERGLQGHCCTCVPIYPGGVPRHAQGSVETGEKGGAHFVGCAAPPRVCVGASGNL